MEGLCWGSLDAKRQEQSSNSVICSMVFSTPAPGPTPSPGCYVPTPYPCTHPLWRGWGGPILPLFTSQGGAVSDEPSDTIPDRETADDGGPFTG